MAEVFLADPESISSARYVEHCNADNTCYEQTRLVSVKISQKSVKGYYKRSMNIPLIAYLGK